MPTPTTKKAEEEELKRFGAAADDRPTDRPTAATTTRKGLLFVDCRAQFNFSSPDSFFCSTMLYGDIVGALVAFPIAGGYLLKVAELDDDHPDRQIAVFVTGCFGLTAVFRALAVAYDSHPLSRISFGLGMTAFVSMDVGGWPVAAGGGEGARIVTTQCHGTIVCILGNVSLSHEEKVARIILVFLAGSFVSVTDPHSSYVAEFLPIVGSTTLLTASCILLWGFCSGEGGGGGKKSASANRLPQLKSLLRRDLVVVHGARIVLASVFGKHCAQVAWILAWHSDSPGEQVSALAKAALVATMGIVATGTFRSEISKKEQLERLVEERTREIRRKNKKLHTVNLALQASETAIAITDSERCIVWSNTAFDKNLAVASSASSSPSSTLQRSHRSGVRRRRIGDGNEQKIEANACEEGEPASSLAGLPLVDVLNFNTKEDRCCLAGAFDVSTRRQDKVNIFDSTFNVEVSPFAEEEKEDDWEEGEDARDSSDGSNKNKTKDLKSAVPTKTGRFLVVFKNITADCARERAEQTAREEKMMVKAMGESMVTLTHELRTPLQGIMGITSLLLQQEQELSSDGMDSLKLIMASSSLLLNLINNLLDVKKDSAKMLEEFSLVSVAASDPIKDAIGFCQPLASISSVELILDVASAPSAFVRSNSLRLQQVLINLVSNAIKYTENGSKIVIGTRQSTMSDVHSRMDRSLASSRGVCRTGSSPVRKKKNNVYAPEGDTDDAMLIFSVSDSGPGIASDQAHRLFRRFAQLDDNSSRRALGSSGVGQPSGTGLGLYLCQLFVQRMKGHIWVTNNNDKKGSTFSFSLPLLINELASNSCSYIGDHHRAGQDIRQLPGPAHCLTACKNGGHPAYKQRVLLVDDTLINRKVLSRILKKIGFSDVTTVDSGHSALVELHKENNYDLVISDLQMPGMSGTELSQAIFEPSPTKTTDHVEFQIPVVIGLTADTRPDVADRCNASGMSDVLYKPITAEDMKKYVETKSMLLRPGVWHGAESDRRHHPVGAATSAVLQVVENAIEIAQ